MNRHVRITDVAPRDGLQNERAIISTESKVRLIERIAASGVDEIEVTSFVSPRWIPQLADAEALLEQLRDRFDPDDRPTFSALVPNTRGLDRAMKTIDAGCPLDKIAVFTAASETFSRRNTNATIDETLERFAPVIERALDRDLETRAYISCVVACPYEGPLEPARTAEVAARLVELGFEEIDLGDTIGAGSPETVIAVIEAVRGEIGDTAMLTLHLHDTFGNAAACVSAALGHAIRSFDGAAGGLGGCPYAGTADRRAPGNIATALLVRTIHDAGDTTTVDLETLAEADALARSITVA